MLRTRRSVSLIAISLFAVLGLSGCSLVPASWSKAFGASNEYTVYFENVAGLYESNAVAVLGMPVGQVTSVEPQGERVKVTLVVDSDISIPENATAAIVNTSIVTTRHIELSPVHTEGPVIPDGGVIPNAKSPVAIGDLFDSIDELSRALSGDEPGEGPVADLVDITSGITSGNGDRIREAIDQLAQAGEIAAGNGDSLVEIIKTVQQLTRALVDNYPKMLGFSKSINEVSQMLGEQSPGLLAKLSLIHI